MIKSLSFPVIPAALNIYPIYIKNVSRAIEMVAKYEPIDTAIMRVAQAITARKNGQNPGTNYKWYDTVTPSADDISIVTSIFADGYIENNIVYAW